jgi:hypothetical protein
MKVKHILAICIGAVSLVALSASATDVNDLWGAQPGNPNTEWNLYSTTFGAGPGNGIMEYLYGAGNFTRVSDTIDQVWAGSPVSATFDAVYSAANQALYTAGLSGSLGSASLILSHGLGTTGTPSRSGSVVPFTPAAQPFVFLDEAGTLNNAFSLQTLNTFDGSKDHMVTFSVSGYMSDPGHLDNTYVAFTTPHYVIAFEDGTDFDYNDLVVEVSGVSPNVPDGGSTVALLGCALAGLGTFSRRFRK